VALWYNPGPGSAAIEVGDRGFSFGTGVDADLDLTPLSANLADMQCRLLVEDGKYLLSNLSPLNDTCIGTRVPKEAAALSAGGLNRARFRVLDLELILSQVDTLVEVDLASHVILLGEYDAKEGQVLVRFITDGADFRMEVSECKVERVK
jgi:hypothetical protein